MSFKKLVYGLLVLLAFGLGMQVDINFETSQVISSDDIAIVNNDQKVDYNDGSLNFGEELVTQIQNSDTKYNYEIVSSPTAEQGLESGKYAASITIPSNLTESVISINSEVPSQSHIDYELNNKLLSNKSESVETEVQNILAKFESKLSYMFVYSIFDSIHTTQEGTETIVENEQPVYTFLEELNEIDIVGNHEYELKENNSDSFETIDLSTEFTKLGQIVTDYNNAVANVIEIYKLENNEYIAIVNDQLVKYNQNTDEIKNRLDNIDDTLNNLVELNTQYTEDDYSLTDSRNLLKKIIIKYLNQLSKTNTMNEDNQKLTEDSTNIKAGIDSLNNTSSYKFIISLLNNRLNYYTSVDEINSCVQSTNDETIAQDCLSPKLDGFASSYTTYQNQLQEFQNEADYYSSLSYYVTHIGEESPVAEAKEESAPVSFEANIEDKTTQTKDVETNKEEETPSKPKLSVTTYNGVSNNSFQFVLEIDNSESQLTQLEIDYSLDNVDGLELLTDGIDANVKTNKIVIKNASPVDYKLSFKATVPDTTKDSVVSIDSYQDQLSAKHNVSNISLNVDKIKTNDSTLEFDVNYTFIGEDKLEIKLDNQQMDLSNIEVKGRDKELVTVNNNTVTLDTQNLQPNDQVTFKLITNAEMNNTNNISDLDYQVNGVSYKSLINPTSIYMSEVNMAVYDDPYVVDDSYPKHDDNDIEAGKYIDNDAVEPEEQVGIKVSLPELNLDTPNLDSISFNLTSDPSIFTDVELVQVNINDSISNLASLEQTGNQVTITNLNAINSESNSEGKYTFDIDIYLNTVASDTFLQEYFNTEDPSYEDPSISISNVVVNTKDLILITNSLGEIQPKATDTFEMAKGNVSLDSVEYSVDESVCKSEATSLEQCSFEGGELVTRTIAITNNDSKTVAPDVNLTETISDVTNLAYDGDTEYILQANDPEHSTASISDEYIDSYKGNEIDMADGKEYNLTIPANSTVTITNKFKVSETNVSENTIEIYQKLGQFDSDELYTSNQEITLKPLSLEVENVKAEQVVDDGIITDGEALKLSFTLRNGSMRAISHNQNVVINNSTSGIVSNIEVISVETDEWENIDSYETSGTTDSFIIKTNYDLKPDSSITYTLKYTFGKVPVKDETQYLTVSSFKNNADSEAIDHNVTNSYKYFLSNANYLQLAQDQLNNDEVVTDEKYIDSLKDGAKASKAMQMIKESLDSLKTYIGNYSDYVEQLDSFTELDNDQISSIKKQLNLFGLGSESKDDEDYQANYEYCTDNDELSCKLFDVYNQIYTAEEDGKDYFASILNTIDPSIEESLGNKTEDGETTEDPVNIGADLNGYSLCDDTEDTTDPATCENVEPGLWNRLDTQDEDIELLSDDIDSILNNELKDVNAEPYKEAASSNSEQMNTKMAETETKNNELFATKIDVYNENYETVMKYVDEISKDKSYVKATKTFKSEEDARQLVTTEILLNISTLMPNTYLDGMPNKLIYSFITKPFNIVQTDTKEQVIVQDTETNHSKLIIITILCLLAIIGALIGMYNFITREE